MIASVNQDGCIECGLCASVCPEVFSMSDSGKAVAIDNDIPSECIETSEEARDACPVSVIDLDK